MDKPEPHSQELFQRALIHSLRKTSYALQKLEQRMILTGHRSDQIASRMQKARELLQSSLPGHFSLNKP